MIDPTRSYISRASAVCHTLAWTALCGDPALRVVKCNWAVRECGANGERSDKKKAYVTLEEGNTIDVTTGL